MGCYAGAVIPSTPPPDPRSGARRRVAWLLVAALLTVLLGVLGRTLASTRRGPSAAEEALDARMRQELVTLGWRPPSSGSLRDANALLRVSHEVEILHVTQPFRLQLDSGVVAAEPPDEAAAAAAHVLVADELGLYPAPFPRRISLRRVALCRALREDGLPIPSLPNYQHTLLLDAEADPAFLRRVLHHEVFHFADLADDGQLLWDPEWDRLNPAGFEYGHGGRDMRDRRAAETSTAEPGFLTRYATSALEEDKAETYSLLMTQPDEVARRATAEPVLAAKVGRLRALLAALDPTIDDAFWERIARQRAR